MQIVGITYNSVSLRWDPVQYDGGVQYSVSALGKNKKETVIYSGSEPRYAVTNLNPGSQYDFIIRSVLIVDGKPLMVDKMIKVHCETDRIPFPGFWHSGTACTPDPNNKTVIMSNAVPNQHLAAVVYSCLSVTPDVCNDKGVASWRVRILGYGQYSSRDIGIGLAPLNPSGSPSCINPGLFFNCRDWCIYMGTELCSSLVMSNPCGPVINPCDDVVVAYCQKEKYIAFTVKGITVTYNIPSIDTNTNFYPTVIMYSYGDSVEIAPTQI